jgi:hypothetical protein
MSDTHLKAPKQAQELLLSNFFYRCPPIMITSVSFNEWQSRWIEMYKYVRFLGWGLLVAAVVYIAAGYLTLAIFDRSTAYPEYLGSFDLLTFGGAIATVLLGVILIRLAGRLKEREIAFDFNLSEDRDIRSALDNNNDVDSELVCEICSSAPAVGVFSSRYGPLSHAACETCSNEGAESMFMACFHIHNAGGPKKAHERFVGMRAYHDERYIGLDEILTHFPEFADEFEDTEIK